MADINLGVGGANSAVAGGYTIDYSLKNESANGERFQTGNLFTNYSSTQTYTFSMWVKRTEIANRGYILNIQPNTGISVYLTFAADSSTQALYYLMQNQSVQAYGKTTALFRDTSAWYHIVFRVDTTQATAADRVRIYVNGVQQDLESGGGGHPAYPSQNYNVPLQQQQYLLGYDGGNNGFSGYCADYYFIDGQSLAPTEFGEFDSATGIWKPIEYTGTFGNEGYHLDFADASALGKDVSTNNQGNFIHYGGSSADQATDTPTNNFATLNPLHYSTWYSINQGATNQISSANGWGTAVSSVGVTQGKWYFETYCSDTAGLFLMGVIDDTNVQSVVNADLHAGDAQYGISYYGSSGAIIANAQTQFAYSFPSYRQDIMGCALDLDNGYLYFSKNGTWGNSGDPTSGSSGTGAITLPTGGTGLWYFATSTYYAAHPQQTNHGGYHTYTISSAASDANGYGTFEYAPPTGYYALCSKNLAQYG